MRELSSEKDSAKLFAGMVNMVLATQLVFCRCRILCFLPRMAWMDGIKLKSSIQLCFYRAQEFEGKDINAIQ